MIRQAKQTDVQRMLDIYSHYVEQTSFTFEYVVPSIAEFAERLVQVQEQYPWLVCEIDGRVVGYAYSSQVFKRAAYQWNADLSIYIEQTYQHKGIATAFYHCLEQILTRQGYYNLFAIITAANQKSLALVKKLGFEAVGHYRNVGYKLGAWHDVCWLVKQLGDVSAVAPEIPVAYPELDKDFVCSVLNKYKI